MYAYKKSEWRNGWWSRGRVSPRLLDVKLLVELFNNLSRSSTPTKDSGQRSLAAGHSMAGSPPATSSLGGGALAVSRDDSPPLSVS